MKNVNTQYFNISRKKLQTWSVVTLSMTSPIKAAKLGNKGRSITYPFTFHLQLRSQGLKVPSSYFDQCLGESGLVVITGAWNDFCRPIQFDAPWYIEVQWFHLRTGSAFRDCNTYSEVSQYLWRFVFTLLGWVVGRWVNDHLWMESCAPLRGVWATSYHIAAPPPALNQHICSEIRCWFNNRPLNLTHASILYFRLKIVAVSFLRKANLSSYGFHESVKN